MEEKLFYFENKYRGKWFVLKARQKRVGEMHISSRDYSAEGLKKLEFLAKVHALIQRRMDELKATADSYQNLIDELYYPAKIAV